jgi:hypothetical protein
MNLRAEDYAALAKDAYRNQGNDYRGRSPSPINGHKYRIIDYVADDVSGFHATAYQQIDAPHAVVIAFRGTDPDIKHHSLTTVQDAAVDAAMVAGKVNPQVASAEKFTRRVLEYAREHGIPTDQVTVTGHSLGGTLAEIESCRFDLGGQTFNAYGAVGLGYGIPEGGSRIIDNVLDGDVVSAASPHYGQVRHFATQEDIDSLREGGYLGGVLASPLVAAVWGDHSISHFAPPAGQPSVLTATCEARAREYAEPIARYRHDVRVATGHVHDATQINPWERMKGRLEVDALLAETGVVSAEHWGEQLAHECLSVENTLVSRLRGFSDPGHPQHAIHAALKERLPPGTSEARLAQCVAACHAARLDKPEDLGDIYITRTRALFLNNNLWGHLAKIDLTQPAPPVEQSLQQVERHDQQQSLLVQPVRQASQRVH